MSKVGNLINASKALGSVASNASPGDPFSLFADLLSPEELDRYRTGLEAEIQEAVGLAALRFATDFFESLDPSRVANIRKIVRERCVALPGGELALARVDKSLKDV